MTIQNIYFHVPPEIEAGLRAGDLIRYGGIVRNRLGQIVAHLKEIPSPVIDEKMIKRVAGTLKNPRVFVPAAVVGGAVVGAVIVLAAKKRRKTGKPEVPECVQNYNASLIAYVEAIHEGCLELDVIDQLIADLDAVEAYSEEDGSITLDFSTKHARMLVNVVVDYTKKLAEANSVDVSELQGVVPDSAYDGIGDLRRHLEAQRKIFTKAA